MHDQLQHFLVNRVRDGLYSALCRPASLGDLSGLLKEPEGAARRRAELRARAAALARAAAVLAEVGETHVDDFVRAASARGCPRPAPPPPARPAPTSSSTPS
eukprot:tig00000455_g987.t1